MNPAANAEWSRFVADKIRAVVKDPATAEKLIPKDHGYAGKRPPYVTDYYQAYNRPNVSLIDLKETPITAVTETGIETADGAARVRHHRLGHRVRLRHRRAQPDRRRRPGRPAAQGVLGRRAAHPSRHHGPSLPELLLPRRAARRGGQQPAVQRRPVGLHRRPDRVRPRARAPGDRSAQGAGRRVDRDGQRGRDHHVAVQRAELLLRQPTSPARPRPSCSTPSGGPSCWK